MTSSKSNTKPQLKFTVIINTLVATSQYMSQGALSLGLRIRENKTPAVMEEINDDISGSFSTPINDELDLESEDSKEKEDSDEGEQQEQERENESEHGEDHHTNELGNHRSQGNKVYTQQLKACPSVTIPLLFHKT